MRCLPKFDRVIRIDVETQTTEVSEPDERIPRLLGTFQTQGNFFTILEIVFFFLAWREFLSNGRDCCCSSCACLLCHWWLIVVSRSRRATGKLIGRSLSGLEAHHTPHTPSQSYTPWTHENKNKQGNSHGTHQEFSFFFIFTLPLQSERICLYKLIDFQGS